MKGLGKAMGSEAVSGAGSTRRGQMYMEGVRDTCRGKWMPSPHPSDTKASSGAGALSVATPCPHLVAAGAAQRSVSAGGWLFSC